MDLLEGFFSIASISGKLIGYLNSYYKCIFGQESFHYILEANRIRT